MSSSGDVSFVSYAAESDEEGFSLGRVDDLSSGAEMLSSCKPGGLQYGD